MVVHCTQHVQEYKATNPEKHSLCGYSRSGKPFLKLVWPKHNMVNQKVEVDVTNNDKNPKCWWGTDQVGVAAVIPAIPYSPPMGCSIINMSSFGCAKQASGRVGCVVKQITFCISVRTSPGLGT